MLRRRFDLQPRLLAGVQDPSTGFFWAYEGGLVGASPVSCVVLEGIDRGAHFVGLTALRKMSADNYFPANLF